MASHDNVERLLNELKNLSNNMQSLLDASADITNEQFIQVRQEAQQALTKTKETISKISAQLVDKTKEGALIVDSYVKENPWKTATIAAGIAVIVSNLFKKNTSSK